jgi:hypothetical protein
MKIKGYQIDMLKPGYVLIHGNTRYIKVQDEPTLRIEGYLLNTSTGALTHWSQITHFDSDVEIEDLAP